MPATSTTTKNEMALKFTHPARYRYFVQTTFPEIGSYTEITIRELLKLTSHLQSLDADGRWPKGQKNEIQMLAAFETWCVYGARFRNQTARAKLRDLIQGVWIEESTRGPFSEHISLPLKDALTIAEKYLEIDKVRFQRYSSESIPSSHENRSWQDELDDRFVDVAGAVDRKVLQLISSKKFVLDFGVYQLSKGSLTLWLENAAKLSAEAHHLPDADLKELVRAGVLIYAGQLRSPLAQKQVRDLFLDEFKPLGLISELGAFDYTESPAFCPPFVITQPVLEVWKQVLACLRLQEPILLVGGPGCGKSEMLRALAFLLGHKCHTICLTDETEPSALVGQQCPCDKGKQCERVRWKDGAVTVAFRNGDWILLDNISDADACVLERLNPLLELPPQWILTENGEIAPLAPQPDFRIVATMTCSTAKAMERYKELSPAVANRFSIIYVEDTPLGKGVSSLATTVLGLPVGEKGASNELEAARQISDDIWKQINGDETAKCLSSPFTFRSFIRFLNCTFLLRLQSPELTLAHALWNSYSITIMRQIKVRLGKVAREVDAPYCVVHKVSVKPEKLELSFKKVKKPHSSEPASVRVRAHSCVLVHGVSCAMISSAHGCIRAYMCRVLREWDQQAGQVGKL